MSKDEVIVQLVDVFRQHGYEGATLARIAAATGLGKASLYHYFPNGKEEMAAAALNHVNIGLEEFILAPLRRGNSPAQRIRALSQSLYEFYSCGQQSCLFAVFSFGDSKNLFQPQILQALNVWIDTLAQVVIEAGFEKQEARQRAEDAVLQIQGALVVAKGLGETELFERVLKRLPEQLLNP